MGWNVHLRAAPVGEKIRPSSFAPPACLPQATRATSAARSGPAPVVGPYARSVAVESAYDPRLILAMARCPRSA